MASLDVLDYLQGLDRALASRGMGAAYRRQALKEARRAIDAMAFKFAILDERPLPEDLDYLRAREALKAPDRAAPVLLKRLPQYRRVRGRRLVTTGIVLLVLFGFGGGLAWLATSESATDLASLSHAVNAEGGANAEVTRSFNVTPEMNRLRFAATVFVSPGNEGNIELFVRGPDGERRLYDAWDERGTHYLRENVVDPEPGEWSLLVAFNGARGSVQLDVSGVSPAR